jgi:metallophosphoesterase (TIGR00282 family)
MPTNRILFLGDVCAEPGREAVKNLLPVLRAELKLDFCIVNGENAAGGYGITPRLAEELFKAGADCITTGDHCFDRKEVWEFLSCEPKILRPLNFPAEAPGRGWGVFNLTSGNGEIVVINLVGRVFMKPVDCPFQRIKSLLNEIPARTPLRIVDFHAEATAEKQALGWFLDSRVSAVIGTHTHIQTADEHILPGGTAYITDAGMCGAFDSVLGMRKDLALRRLIELVPVRLLPATADIRLNGVIIDLDAETGRSTRIERLVMPLPAT